MFINKDSKQNNNNLFKLMLVYTIPYEYIGKGVILTPRNGLTLYGLPRNTHTFCWLFLLSN